LSDYLRTVGKNLKHTHALEAVARMNGHKSWNTFQAEAEGKDGSNELREETGSDLAGLFASGELCYVELEGMRFNIWYYNSEVLGVFDEIVQGTAPDDFSLGDVCVELEAIDDEGRVFEHTLSVEEISQSKKSHPFMYGDEP
jgi:hypothetical protein